MQAPFANDVECCACTGHPPEASLSCCGILALVSGMQELQSRLQYQNAYLMQGKYVAADRIRECAFVMPLSGSTMDV